MPVDAAAPRGDATRGRATRRALPVAACAAGAAGAAACLGWFAWDGAAALAAAREAASRSGAALRVRAVERDLSGLAVALDAAAPGGVASAFADLRAGLAETLAAEVPARRLDPGDLERLARFARDLDLAVAGGAGEVGAALRGALAGRADELAAAAAVLEEVEATASAALRAAQDRIAFAAPPALAAALALSALAAAAAALSRPVAPAEDVAALRARLAEETEAARLAKARFVMMMSHELRTPMNGMLGLLAVMKEYDPPETLRPLIDKAERAGRQLVAMLGDLLEVELDPAPAPAPQAVCIDDLARSLQDMFGPAADRAGTGFEVTVKGEVPAQASGDGVKFQRAVSQLCGQVVEQAGVSDVAVALSHSGDEMVAELSFAHAAGPEAGLKLVEPAPAPPRSDDAFGAPGLGPLLAKGLLEQIGGRLEVCSLDSGRVLVLAAAPSRALAEESVPAPDAPQVEPLRPRVRVIAQTRSLGAIGAAAAAAGGVDVLSAEEAPAPDVVLIEAGGEEEARALAEARAAWPAAVVLALGTPDAPGGFDGVLPSPLEPAVVAREVVAAWARSAASLQGDQSLVSTSG